MLLDVMLACAPFVVVIPAVAALLTCHVGYASRRRLQKRLYQTLLLVEKLPAELPGTAALFADIERQTLHVGYLAQYPHRSREVLRIALIGGGLIGTVAAYYLLLSTDATWLALLAALGSMLIASLWFKRALVNFSRNDTLIRELFARFGAPRHLHRPHTELVARAPALSVEVLLERATTVRDADHSASVRTLDAVNSVLAQAHLPLDWRREARDLARRGRAAGAASHDWLLRHLLGPFFQLRLAILDDRERHRIAAADRSGDVYKAAWLANYYRDERIRLTKYWTSANGRPDGRRTPRWPRASKRRAAKVDLKRRNSISGR